MPTQTFGFGCNINVKPLKGIGDKKRNAKREFIKLTRKIAKL
jgi:hypothetical protein